MKTCWAQPFYKVAQPFSTVVGIRVGRLRASLVEWRKVAGASTTKTESSVRGQTRYERPNCEARAMWYRVCRSDTACKDLDSQQQLDRAKTK